MCELGNAFRVGISFAGNVGIGVDTNIYSQIHLDDNEVQVEGAPQTVEQWKEPVRAAFLKFAAASRAQYAPELSAGELTSADHAAILAEVDQYITDGNRAFDFMK